MLLVFIGVTLGTSPEGERILIQAMWEQDDAENIWMTQKGTEIRKNKFA